MNAKDIIKLNNEMREQLTEENSEYYGDMLVYIRTNFNKSERYTEEVLLELLEHLLGAQQEGRTAREVFGEDLKAYCNEIIGEIPAEKKTNRLSFIIYIVLNLAGVVGLTVGLIGYVLHHFFSFGSGSISFPVGTGMLIILIDLLLLLLFIFIILKWIKRSTFKKKQQRKWVEFLQLWIICFLFIGLTLVGPQFLPDIGSNFHISFVVIALFGALIYLTSFVINKKFRITK